MSGGGENFTLRECLVDFLRGKISEMPKIEARIVNLDPLLVTDDSTHYFEIPGLEEAVSRLSIEASSAKKLPAQNKGQASKTITSIPQRLVLVDWNYTLKKVPQTAGELFVDIEADTLRVENISSGERDSNPVLSDLNNLMEDTDVKYYSCLTVDFCSRRSGESLLRGCAVAKVEGRQRQLLVMLEELEVT